jgi:branched-subunit amino acid transport protein AzlD
VSGLPPVVSGFVIELGDIVPAGALVLLTIFTFSRSTSLSNEMRSPLFVALELVAGLSIPNNSYGLVRRMPPLGTGVAQNSKASRVPGPVPRP